MLERERESETPQNPKPPPKPLFKPSTSAVQQQQSAPGSAPGSDKPSFASALSPSTPSFKTPDFVSISPPPSFNETCEAFIPLSSSTFSTLASPWSTAVICKVIGKSFSSAYLLSALMKLWNLDSKPKWFSLGKGFYVMDTSESDCHRIISKGPWFIHSHLVFCQPWSPGFKPSEASLASFPVWVSLPELPMEFHSVQFLKEIGNSLGQFVRADLRRDKNQLRFARIQVIVDVSSKLKSAIWIGNLFQSLVWEDPPSVCPHCNGVRFHGDSCSCLKTEAKGASSPGNCSMEPQNSEGSVQANAKSSNEWTEVVSSRNARRNKKKRENRKVKKTSSMAVISASTVHSTKDRAVSSGLLPGSWILAEYFKTKGTQSKPPPYQIPPIPPPSQIQLTFLTPLPPVLSLMEKPPISFPEVLPDSMTFWIKIGQSLVGVPPHQIRQFIRRPELVTAPYLDMIMEGPDMLHRPAHLPNYGDLLGLCPVAAVPWGQELDVMPHTGKEIIREDLLFLVDPAMQFPQLRTLYSLSSPLHLEMGAFTNSLFIAQSEPAWTSWDFLAKAEMLRESGLGVTKVFMMEANFGKPGVSEVSMGGSNSSKTPHPNPIMSFLAWNARGIARPSFENNLRHLAHHHRPDLIFICERRTSRRRTKRIIKDLPFDDFFYAEPMGFSGGLLLMWNTAKVSFTPAGSDLHAIHGTVKVDSLSDPIFLSCIYASTKFRSRLATWDELCLVASYVNSPWLVMGDFNEVVSQNEKFGGRPVKLNRSSAFSDCLNDCGLIDLEFSGNKFTWTNKRKKRPIMERLDRVVANASFLQTFPNCSVKHLLRLNSDHCPLLTTCIPAQSSSEFKKSFKLELAWYSDLSFVPLVENAWDRASNDILSNLTSLKACIEPWVESTFKKNLTAKNKLLSRLAGAQRALENDPSNCFLWDLEFQLNHDLQIFLDQEEAFWKLRARDSWLQGGDRNTKFFQSSVLLTRKRNKILYLKDEVGNEFFDKVDISNHASSFFLKLFTTEKSFSLSPSTSYAASLFVSHRPSFGEIRDAVFSMGPYKAPGEDGFHNFFYQKHWSVVQNEVCHLVWDVFASCRVPPAINKTIISLIPKVDHPESLKHYRPISLCNSTYKIVSKILVQRIRPLLQNIISPNQNSFLPGRGTEVNYIVASEALHSTRIKKGRKSFFALKVDLEKAYDRLEWDFIRECLRSHEFDPKSIELIMSCITTTETSVLINGEPTQSFHPTRGIRQGDPLSPYIFILCMEALTRLINDECDAGNWVPISIGRGKVKLSHLLFADDLVLFGDTSDSTLDAVIKVLNIFHSQAGQKVNNSKSKLYFSKNTPLSVKDDFTQALEVDESSDLGTYLGYPLTDRRPTKAQLEPIISRIQKKLALWKSAHLSKAGRTVLISSTLSAIPIYSMQCLALPVSCLDRIEKIMRDFFWGSSDAKRRLHLVGWEKICSPVDKGGLGLRDQKIFNKIFMAKLCWKMHSSHNLAANVIRSKYCTGPIPTPFPRGSHIWQDMGKGWDVFQSKSRWCLGSGESILFWHDTWLGLGPLRRYIQGPLSVEEDNRCVSSLIHDLAWNLSTLTIQLPPSIIQSILAVQIPSLGQDELVCPFARGPFFDSNLLYSYLWNENKPHQPIAPSFDWDCIRSGPFPPKVKTFLWQIVWNSIPCNATLASRGISTSAMCPFCPNIPETWIHVLRDCPRARECWLATRLPIALTSQEPLDWLALNLSNSTNASNVPFNTSFAFGCWNIWRRRNKWVFDRVSDQLAKFEKEFQWTVNEFVWSREVANHVQPTVPVPIPDNCPVITCDATFCEQSGTVAFGCTYRINTGAWKNGLVQKFFSSDATTAELQGIFACLQWASQNDLHDFILATDSLIAMTGINGLTSINDCYVNLYHQCRVLVKACRAKVIKVRREHVREADALAKWVAATLIPFSKLCTIFDYPFVCNDGNIDVNLGVCLNNEHQLEVLELNSTNE
ncbi:hypothetical protein RDABS01_015553, partial [Bienertia sinuspersici]